MGSGTTLLRLMLDSHENIAIPHETGFMRAYNAMQFIPFKWTGRGWARRLGWSQQELDQELQRFFDRIFMRYAEQHGKKRWGEKTPLHTWHITAMKRVFPDSVFIGIVRHPGAAIASNMRRFYHPLWRASYHYLRYNKEIVRQAGRYPRRMAIIRYEDLVQQPEKLMRELLEWLGEPWSESVLQHHVIQSEEREHERIEGKSSAGEAIDPARTASWAGKMSRREREDLEYRVGRLGEFFGYSFDDPTALEPLRRNGSLLLKGKALRRRIDRFPDLDIRTRMPVPVHERFWVPTKVELREKELPGPKFGPNAPVPAESPVTRAARRVESTLPTPVRERLRRAVRGSARPGDQPDSSD